MLEKRLLVPARGPTSTTSGGSGGGPGAARAVLTQLWFTGDLEWPRFQDTVLRIYVDEEHLPSIEGPLGELHGIGFDDINGPWGTAAMGKLGSLGGGLYNSHRIPFASHVRVTCTTTNQTQERGFFFMARGLELHAQETELTVTLPHSFLELPATARLRTFHFDGELQPTEWAVMMDAKNGTGEGGLVYLVTQVIDSESAHSLEGIHVAEIDRGGGAAAAAAAGGGGGAAGEGGSELDDDDGIVQLSSGTEDYFLSAQYFDAGTFRTPLSGLTHMSSRLYPKRISAYRFHTADPVLFSESMTLKWRNGIFSNGSLAAKKARLSSYVWAYMWPTTTATTGTTGTTVTAGETKNKQEEEEEEEEEAEEKQ
eukprot:g106.t1